MRRYLPLFHFLALVFLALLVCPLWSLGNQLAVPLRLIKPSSSTDVSDNIGIWIDDAKSIKAKDRSKAGNQQINVLARLEVKEYHPGRMAKGSLTVLLTPSMSDLVQFQSIEIGKLTTTGRPDKRLGRPLNDCTAEADDTEELRVKVVDKLSVDGRGVDKEEVTEGSFTAIAGGKRAFERVVVRCPIDVPTRILSNGQVRIHLPVVAPAGFRSTPVVPVEIRVARKTDDNVAGSTEQPTYTSQGYFGCGPTFSKAGWAIRPLNVSNPDLEAKYAGQLLASGTFLGLAGGIALNRDRGRR